jgi:hypothetical protein
MRRLPRTVLTARCVGSITSAGLLPFGCILQYSYLRSSADAAGLNPMHVCSRHVASNIVDNR